MLITFSGNWLQHSLGQKENVSEIFMINTQLFSSYRWTFRKTHYFFFRCLTLALSLNLTLIQHFTQCGVPLCLYWSCFDSHSLYVATSLKRGFATVWMVVPQERRTLAVLPFPADLCGADVRMMHIFPSAWILTWQRIFFGLLRLHARGSTGEAVDSILSPQD